MEAEPLLQCWLSLIVFFVLYCKQALGSWWWSMKRIFIVVLGQVEEKGLSEETADKIGKLVDMKGEPMAVLEKLETEGSPFLENAGSKSALKELGTLFHYLQNANCLHRISFDLSLARGLDYYTGVIYEAVFKGSTSSSSETGQVTQVACKHLIFFPSFPLQIFILVVSLANCSIAWRFLSLVQFGSIAAGGRYDNLVGMFSKQPVPAVGVSLGIERVFAIMEQQLQDGSRQVWTSVVQFFLFARTSGPVLTF